MQTVISGGGSDTGALDAVGTEKGLLIVFTTLFVIQPIELEENFMMKQ